MRDTNHIVISAVTAFAAGSTVHYFGNADHGVIPYVITTRVSDFFAGMVPEKKIFAWLFVAGMFFLYLLGSVWPDTDHPYSGIGKIIYIPVFEHHTYMHAIYIPAALCAAGIFVKPFLFFGMGMLVHGFFDSFSYNGNKWFYPFGNKHHFFRLYGTSCLSEYVFVTVVVLVMLSWSVFCWMDVIQSSWLYMVLQSFL